MTFGNRKMSARGGKLQLPLESALPMPASWPRSWKSAATDRCPHEFHVRRDRHRSPSLTRSASSENFMSANFVKHGKSGQKRAIAVNTRARTRVADSVTRSCATSSARGCSSAWSTARQRSGRRVGGGGRGAAPPRSVAPRAPDPIVVTKLDLPEARARFAEVRDALAGWSPELPGSLPTTGPGWPSCAPF